MANTATPRRRYLAVGRIVGPHGIRGEVKVEVLTDFPERFRAGAKMYLGPATGETTAAPVVLAAARPHKMLQLVKLTSTPDRNAAELLRDQYLLIPEEEAMPLGDHENYIHDLIGIAVVTDTGATLGTITEILFTGANDVYVVAGPDGEVLLPALREVVLAVDLAARRMTVALPDGLLAPASELDD